MTMPYYDKIDLFKLLHCFVLFYLPNGSSPIYDPIKLGLERFPKATRKEHLRGQNSQHAYYSKSTCQVVKDLITELKNHSFMLVLNSS